MEQSELATWITGIMLALLLSASCSNLTPEAQTALFSRRVNLTMWGFWWTSEAGVMGIGYAQYQRNPTEILEPVGPPIPRPTIP